ncbi:hypothetical protein ACQKP8_26330 [Photobacterium alginatilyticum]|uniref:hypothetical protein n=1 Tax=Photobacterium alginatilyticum TaxID=1775171 RepID=UPI004067A6BA
MNKQLQYKFKLKSKLSLNLVTYRHLYKSINKDPRTFIDGADNINDLESTINQLERELRGLRLAVHQNYHIEDPSCSPKY